MRGKFLECSIQPDGGGLQGNGIGAQCRVLFVYLLIEETDGTLSCEQTASARSRSLISQANMVGFSLLYFAMASTTTGVATFGFDPPITPAL